MNIFSRAYANALKLIKSPPPDAPRVIGGEIAVADPSRLFPKGWSVPYNPSDLVGKQGLRIFAQMMRDDQVKAAVKFKKNAIVATGWTVKSPEGKDDTWEPNEFIKKMFEELNGSVERLVGDILTSLQYGFSVSEIIFAEKDGKITIPEIKTRAPHDITFAVDEYGNLLSIRQQSEELPTWKFIVHVHEFEFGNWYGNSDLEAAHRAWWLKKNAYQWMAMLMERLGIPPIFAMYNPDDYKGDQLDKLKSILKNLQAATVGIIPRSNPDGLEMWSPEIKGEITEVFVPALEMLNRDISRALLMPGLLGMTDDSEEGSYARAQVHFDAFILVIEQIRRDIAKQVMNNLIIKPLVDLNFGPQEHYPCFEFNPLSDEVRVDLLTAWGSLTGQKVVTPTLDDEKHIRKLLKMPELSAEGEAMRTEREEAEREQQEIATETQRKVLEEPLAPPGAAKKPTVKENKIVDTNPNDGGFWVTISGRKVFIKDGESVTAKIKEINDKNSQPPKKKEPKKPKVKKPKEEEKDTPVDPEVAGRIRKNADDVSKKHGVKPEQIDIRNSTRAFEVGGDKYTEAAHFNPATGNIQLNANNFRLLSDSGQKAIIEHEISHMKWHHAVQNTDREFYKFVAENVKELEQQGRATSKYANSYWEAVKGLDSNRSDHIKKFVTAANESLAEMKGIGQVGGAYTSLDHMVNQQWKTRK